MTRIVVLTDHPWSDLGIEREIIEGAGHALISGQARAGSASAIEELVRKCDPIAIMTCWAPLSVDAIRAPSNLKIVARLGVGVDNIAVAEATARAAWVTNVPDYCVAEVSDHAVALVLASLREIVRLDRAVKASGWHIPSFAPARLSTLTVGIIGYGRIGSETARKIRAFGCRVLAYRPKGFLARDGVESVTIEAIQAMANVIILHAPLNADTENMVDDKFIAACAARPLIVNVSRGGLIENDALIRGLETGLLRGAALDVIADEPFPPLTVLNHPDIIVTPHVAFSSHQSMEQLRREASEEVVRVIRGEVPLHPVNRPVPAKLTEALTSGVSSDVELNYDASGPIVIKTALPKLKVDAHWLADPKRAATEVRALRAAAELVGAYHVPGVLWEKPAEFSFAMRRVDPRLRNWKQDLLAGNVDMRTAREAGRLVGTLHARSRDRPDLAHDFDDLKYFRELRIIPFFEHVADRLPHLSNEIETVVSAMNAERRVLVHGDYSPKNILADGGEVVMLDFEVAHWGDPRFDVAFCLSHLVLKSYRVGADAAALELSSREFLHGYESSGTDSIDGEALVRLVGCLMLARLDGDSPVDYLDEIPVGSVRERAIDLLRNPSASIYSMFSSRSSQSVAKSE